MRVIKEIAEETNAVDYVIKGKQASSVGTNLPCPTKPGNEAQDQRRLHWFPVTVTSQCHWNWRAPLRGPRGQEREGVLHAPRPQLPLKPSLTVMSKNFPIVIRKARRCCWGKSACFRSVRQTPLARLSSRADESGEGGGDTTGGGCLGQGARSGPRCLAPGQRPQGTRP